jgi:hypothetical protein
MEVLMIGTVCKIDSSIFNIKPKIFQMKKIFSGFYGGIVFIPVLLIFTGFYFNPFTVAHAATARTNSISEFNNAIANADPGDTIILTDGRYDTSSTTIRFSANGTAGNEVVITAETPGGVIFTGPQTFADVSGSYQIIHGFHFKDIDTSGNWNTNVIKINNASHNRITNCKFENIGQGGGSTLIGVWYNSPHNRFDHNTWDGNDGVGIETPLRYYEDMRKSTHTKIDHNVFKNHAKDDASEALRLGRGATSGLVKAYMTIEYNLFENWHGDPETFSVKSSNNLIRYNVVRNCNGGMKLRQGDNNVLDGNYYILEDDRALEDYPLAIAIKIKGSDHKVINNYIYRGWHGISLEKADPLPSYRGAVTSKPTSTNQSYLIDANATWTDGSYNKQYVWITSGGGQGRAYYIQDTDAANKRLYCKVKKGGPDADLLSDGVTSGSAYTINPGDPEVRNLLLANNTIINIARNSIMIKSTSKNCRLINNLAQNVKDSGVYSIFNQDTGAQIFYETNLSNSIGNMKTWIGPGGQPQGIIDGDPNLKFDGRMHRLQATSDNAINKGTTDLNVKIDIEGQPRDPSGQDIGADEYSSQPIVRTMIKEGIGYAGVQWPNSTVDEINLSPPSGLRVVN